MVAVPRSSHHGYPPSNPLAEGAPQGRRWIAMSRAAGVLEFLRRLCGDPDSMEEQGSAGPLRRCKGGVEENDVRPREGERNVQQLDRGLPKHPQEKGLEGGGDFVAPL